MTAGWDETEVLMDVSSRRLAPVQHRHLPARGLLSLFSFLRAFLLTVVKRNQGFTLHQCVADGPGRMAPPPLGDRIKMNGAYRHPALDARVVVCIAKAARITRDRPARPLNAPSLLMFAGGGIRNSEDRTTTAPGTRWIILLHCILTPFFARVPLARAQHAARALARASLNLACGCHPFFCCPCSVRLCLSAAVRNAIGSHEARARSTPRTTSGRSATCRSHGERESGLPPEAECRSTPKRSKNIMTPCRLYRAIYIKPRRSCVTVVTSFKRSSVIKRRRCGPSAQRRWCTGGRRRGEQSANVLSCVLLPSPFLPFTACVCSLSMVIRWEGGAVCCCYLYGCCGRLVAAVVVVVRFDEKYSAFAGLVHAFESWQRCV